MSKSRAWRPAAALIIGLATLGALHQTVIAIPSLTDHRHDAPHVTWSAAAIPPGDENLIAHQHRSARDFDNDGDPADTNGPYDAYQVWDNTALRLDAAGSFDKGHGFIEAPNQPRYCIQAGVPAGAVGRIVDAFNAWEAIGADGGLRWGLDFKRVDPCPAGDPAALVEIRVTWGDTTAVGATNSTQEQLADCGPPAGSQPCRVWMRFNDTLSWDYDVNPAGVANTDYHFYTTALHEVGHVVGLYEQKDHDDVMFFLQGAGCSGAVKESGTSTGGTATDLVDNTKNWTADEFKDDWVRILTGNPRDWNKITGNTANTLSGQFNWKDSSLPVGSYYEIVPGAGGRWPCFGAIDADSIQGARDLYSIPQPTPPTPPPWPTLPTNRGVGGIAELPPVAESSAQSATPADGSGWSAVAYAGLAAGLAAAAVVLTAVAWYARRRWVR